MEDKKIEKDKKKVKGGRVQVGKRMPAGRKAAVTHHSSSESSHEEEGEDVTRESQVRDISTMGCDIAQCKHCIPCTYKMLYYSLTLT